MPRPPVRLAVLAEVHYPTPPLIEWRVLDEITGNPWHGPMTLTEAAAILGTSPDNLRAAIARGSLKAEKHGRDWWVQPAEVERYAREHRRVKV